MQKKAKFLLKPFLVYRNIQIRIVGVPIMGFAILALHLRLLRNMNLFLKQNPIKILYDVGLRPVARDLQSSGVAN